MAALEVHSGQPASVLEQCLATEASAGWRCSIDPDDASNYDIDRSQRTLDTSSMTRRLNFCALAAATAWRHIVGV